MAGAPTLRSAFAISFDWTSAGAGADLTVTVPSAGVAYTCTIPTTTARVFLGYGATPGTVEPLPDFLQIAEAAINAGIVATGRTVTVELDANGKVVVSIDSGDFDMDASAKPVGAILGFTIATTGAGTYTAAYQPKYLALMASCYGGAWDPKAPGAWGMDDTGASWGIASGLRSWERTYQIGYVPKDPTEAAAAGCVSTPKEPAASDLDSIGSHVVPWGWEDVLAAAGGRGCALAAGNMQQLRTLGGGDRYDLVALPGEMLTAPKFDRVSEAWERWWRFALSVVRRSDYPNSTR